METQGDRIMLNRIVFIFVYMIMSINCNAQHWNNPENEMLNDSLSSFFYYSTKGPQAFSDPGSLADTERRARISDNYHDQIDSELQAHQERLRMEQQNRRKLYNSNKPYYYNPNYKLHYLHRQNIKY